jgi:DNA primase
VCSPRPPDKGVKSHDSKSSETASLIRREGAGVNIFETLREQVAIGRLIESDSGGKAHCVAPGHQDNDPSMHVYDDHVHCFACGFHGDVTDLWTAIRGFGRPVEAALDLAREFGIELPEASPEARKRAKERREKEDLCLV